MKQNSLKIEKFLNHNTVRQQQTPPPSPQYQTLLPNPPYQTPCKIPYLEKINIPHWVRDDIFHTTRLYTTSGQNSSTDSSAHLMIKAHCYYKYYYSQLSNFAANFKSCIYIKLSNKTILLFKQLPHMFICNPVMIRTFQNFFFHHPKPPSYSYISRALLKNLSNVPPCL